MVAHDITHFLFACLCLKCSIVSRQRTVRTFWSEQMFIFISQLAQWGRTVLQLGLQLSRYLCHCSGTPWPWRPFFFFLLSYFSFFFFPRHVTTHAGLRTRCLCLTNCYSFPPSGRCSRSDTAMTGEITLRGLVLPVSFISTLFTLTLVWKCREF